MSILIVSIVGAAVAGAMYFFARMRAIAATRKEMGQKDELIELSAQIIPDLQRQVRLLETALSTQLVERSSEVGIPPPSGAYHTVFYPTGDGRVMMVYLCLDSGHIARWHFYSVEAIESEAKRLFSVAQEVRNKTLPQNPEFLSVHVGNNGTVH